MTSIIIAALGVAVVGLTLLALELFLRLGKAHLRLDQLESDYWATVFAYRDARCTIARLSPLAEIGERRLIADRKYKAKHRKGASAPQTGLSSLRDEAASASSPEASIPNAVQP